MLGIALKRLLAYPGLTLAMLIGLTTLGALAMVMPLYTEAINYKILLETLAQSHQRTHRPPFTYRYSYLGSLRGLVAWKAVIPVDQYLTEIAPQSLGLPVLQVISHFETDTFRLFPTDTINYESDANALSIMSFAFTRGIETQINVVEGRFPHPAATDLPSHIPVMVTEAFAQEAGLQVGETYIAFNHHDDSPDARHQISVQIVGLWQPRDPTDQFWFNPPDAFDESLLVTEAVFVNQLTTRLNDDVRLGVWSLLMDGTSVDTSDVNRLLGRASRVLRQAEDRLPGINVSNSPVTALQAYRKLVREQTWRFMTFTLPILGLMLAFIGLMAEITTNERRNEVAVMRGRGATRLQMIATTVIEGLLLGLVALALGAGLSIWLTYLVGQTRSFLDFSVTNPLRVSLTPLALGIGAATLGIAILAQLVPMVVITRQTITHYKQERSRLIRHPWWQRHWLDVGLLLLIFYIFDQARQQGGLRLPTEADSIGHDPFQNPLLFLVPTLAILAVTLFFLRLLPFGLRLISTILRLTNSVGSFLAISHLARQSRGYTTPFILLVMMVSLSIFNASTAQTIDIHLVEQSYYRHGADFSLVPDIQLSDPSAFGTDEQGRPLISMPNDFFAPVADYQAIPGIEAAARVGRYQARTNAGKAGVFVGVDRVDFGQAAYWRSDFAPQNLGTLLNMLAGASNNVLVSRDVVQDTALTIGDTVLLTVKSVELEVDLNLQIVGVVDYFPGWYPMSSGPLFVGHLDYFFTQIGNPMPHNLWLRRETSALDRATLEGYLEAQQLPGQVWYITESLIEQEQQRPERQGTFGLLSVGLVATTGLTILGILIYNLYTFRQRTIELGLMRAIGLSRRQMTVIVVWELTLFLVLGLGLGTGLGVWISQIMVPFFQGGARRTDLIPPYIVEISWPAIYQVIVLFSLLLVVVLLLLIPVLARMKIFQAIKLGETV